MLVTFMVIPNVKATPSGDAKQLELHYHDAGVPWGKPIKRSIRSMMQAFLSETHIILSPSVADSGCAHITIKDNNGDEVKNETVTLVPGQDTLLYIGDLAAGIYELTIETDSYTLHGSFEVE